MATESFTAAAQGDLDGNQTTSDFSLLGQIQGDNGTLVVTLAPNILENKPDE